MQGLHYYILNMTLFILEQFHWLFIILCFWLAYTSEEPIFYTTTITITSEDVLDEVEKEVLGLDWGVFPKIILPLVSIPVAYIWYCIIRGIPLGI